jgi:hypothetical protein
MAMFDLSSSWVEGSCCPLAGRGYSRDSRAGTLQIEYGLLTDAAARWRSGVPGKYRRPPFIEAAGRADPFGTAS